jgi:hypothetical protein
LLGAAQALLGATRWQALQQLEAPHPGRIPAQRLPGDGSCCREALTLARATVQSLRLPT